MLIRAQYLSKIREFYNSKLIKILVGIRRCGKSTILRQIIDELRWEEKFLRILYMNF